MIKNISDLYIMPEKKVSSKYVHSQELNELAENIDIYKHVYTNQYQDEEILFDTYMFIKKIFLKLCSSISHYSTVVNKNDEMKLIEKLSQIKIGYPEFFHNTVVPLAKSLKFIMEMDNNFLTDFLCKQLEIPSENKARVAIVTRLSLSELEKELILKKAPPLLDVSFYTENGYRKTIRNFNYTFFIGNTDYFGSAALSVLKAEHTYFISYEMFSNRVYKPQTFNKILESNVLNTIYNNVTIENSVKKDKQIIIDREDFLDETIQRVFKNQEYLARGASHNLIEANLIFIENNQILFVPKNAKLRILSPYNKKDFIKQIEFKELEVDDYIIIRNERDSKLIAEVADAEVLKGEATKLRALQKQWKKRLRKNIDRKGSEVVSRILTRRYHMKTASILSLRLWCNEDTICPAELTLLLRALKYNGIQVDDIYSSMKKIQNAHRQAGRIITKKLMNELKPNIYEKLQEQGHHTFNSKEFNRASFNIERVTSIDYSKYKVYLHDLMKPFRLNS
ncbi:hypothetical protein [Priestia endophytica]|uniref:DISARM anti-phage system protein DrmE domain-containing protein n=1 Tax=Priestia endophytica TaxID=135735 RepID=UPI000DCA7B1E|nr:hypothetical protein [Priestia endophytica]RAS80759.1 hypothetical protein A4U60_14380 [Priestia endophytica]